MKELLISNITQKVTLIEKKKGPYKLAIQSEDNKPFRICVNTEKYFDNNSPNFKNVEDGYISVDIDADANDVYELMILCDNKNEELLVRYNLQLIDEKVISDANNERLHEERKQKLMEIANYAANLDEKHSLLLNKLLTEITMLYKEKYLEDADNKLNFLHQVTKTDLSNVLNYLDSLITNGGNGNDCDNGKENKDRVENKGFTISTLNIIIIISLVIFFVFIFLLMKFTNKSGKISAPKNLFAF